MKHDPFDALLAAYAKQPLPTEAGPSAGEVWREIERRRTQSIWARMFSSLELRELFSEPRMAVVAVALAAIVGVVPAALVGRTENAQRLARRSIHFEVFAMDSGSLGSVFVKPVALVPTLKP
jgi:ABC-type nitrate/sulfonate/bicarbonate transport system permease component